MGWWTRLRARRRHRDASEEWQQAQTERVPPATATATQAATELDYHAITQTSSQLKFAEENKKLRIVQKILHNATTNATTMDAIKRKVLHWASNRGSIVESSDFRRGQVEIVKQILRTGIRPDNYVDRDGHTALWIATEKNDLAVVKLLLDAHADANYADAYGRTPLWIASDNGYRELVDLLIRAKGNVNTTDRYGCAPLHAAASKWDGRCVEVANLLLSAGANFDAVDKRGRTALHSANNFPVARRILEAGASTTPVDNVRTTGLSPLHVACDRMHHDIVRVLLEFDADVHTPDSNGYQALHWVLFAGSRRGCLQLLLEIMQMLVGHGAEWDQTCDDIADQEAHLWPLALYTGASDEASERWKKEAPAIRVCIHQWMLEFKQGVTLTDIPIEQVQNGVVSTVTFIRELHASDAVVFRRKICVVGPSSWGKTSLIKSLTSDKPSLVHPLDRTIGIDHFKLSFEQQLSADQTKSHEVTFWDFAGQDAYQAAHSLFFSARTLYVVCVDLESYAIAHMQAELMTETSGQANKWLNEFIDEKILQWIRLIFSHQPDAEFVFVGTKKDRVRVEDLTDEDGAVADLRKRLENVMVIVRDMAKTRQSDAREEEGTPTSACSRPITHLGDDRLTKVMEKPVVPIILSSCAAPEYVRCVKEDIQTVITKSDRGFPMPDKFSRVLEAVVQMRTDAARRLTDVRLAQMFADVEELVRRLVAEVKGDANVETSSPYLDAPTCRTILETLHQLGDVLWYQDMKDPRVKTTVILDPLLLIDFVRQVINHKFTSEKMTHSVLKGLPLWTHLKSDSMFGMKTVLQHFHLVLPTEGTMAFDTDLIVPAFWKSNICAFWKFGGGELRLTEGTDPEAAAVRVHWEIHFENLFPGTLFDQLVIASFVSTSAREVGPDWILCKETNKWACRVVIGRDELSHDRTLHLEALAAKDCASLEGQKGMWEAFERICEAFSVVLRRYPGLLVTSCARQGNGDKPSLRSLKTLSHGCNLWLPPPAHHHKCRDLLTIEPSR